MKFLSKLGSLILKGAQIVTGIAPFVSQFVPGSSATVTVVSKDLNELAQIIQDVEVAGQALSLPGAQKLQAAAPLFAQVILSSALLVGHSINDPVLFNAGAQKMADGLADVLNSLKVDGIQTTSKT